MTKTMKSVLGAVALTVLTAGAAYAAAEMKCCCKDEAGKMECCDKKAATTPTQGMAH